MKNWHLLLLALIGSTADATEKSSRKPASDGPFSCKESEEGGPSPTWSKECESEATKRIAEICGIKPNTVKLGKITLTGNATNAAGGCNHTYSVLGGGGPGACQGGDQVEVSVEATRGGCLLE